MSLEDIGPKPSHGVRDEEAAWARVLRVKRATLYGVVVILIAVVVGGFFGFKIVIDTQQQLKSCVETTGQCYKDAQKQTADIVGEPRGPINTVHVLAIACAPFAVGQTPDEQAKEIAACVVRLLKEG